MLLWTCEDTSIPTLELWSRGREDTYLSSNRGRYALVSFASGLSPNSNVSQPILSLRVDPGTASPNDLDLPIHV